MAQKIDPPTQKQLERLRLLLSTYQDGTGMLINKDGTSLPGWRDFERSVASAFDGQSQESKSIFDVLVPLDKSEKRSFGVSCKMRKELPAAMKSGRVLIELSNSSGKFWDALAAHGMQTMEQVNVNPAKAGRAILGLVSDWHHSAKGTIDLAKSYYLVLLYDLKSRHYQLFQFPLYLPDAISLDWRTRESTKESPTPARCLIGKNSDGTLIEWYGSSGGQLKFYPSVKDAIWQSEIFMLEPLPKSELGYGIVQKAQLYFPKMWERTV